jgi:predicted  nucleic acid-binding Zn-ribbon protein
MADNSTPPTLNQIIELSKIDVLIAGLEAQRKKIESDVAGRRQAIVGYEDMRAARGKLLESKKALVGREEAAIKHERERINERRRSLAAMNDYKVQQAAEREIEFVSKQVGQREEVLLGVMREVEVLERDIANATASITNLSSELGAFETDSAAVLSSITERLSQYNQQRSEIIGSVGPGNAVIVSYNRVRTRYPMDPIAPLLNRDSCGGCHMKVGPQLLVHVSRGDVVKCPGCSRILRLDEPVAAA